MDTTTATAFICLTVAIVAAIYMCVERWGGGK